MNNRELYIVVTLLVVLGLGLFVYKAVYLQFPVMPHMESKAWDIEVRVLFNANKGPVKVYLQIPQSSQHLAIVDEQFVSRGYGMSTRQRDDNRMVIWSLREAKGEQVLFYRAAVRPVDSGIVPPTDKVPELKKITLDDVKRVAAEGVLAEVRARSADTETFVIELMKYINQSAVNGDTGNLKLLLGIKPTAIKKLSVAVDLLAVAGIPARIAHGIRLQTLDRRALKEDLLQVFQHTSWMSYHPLTGQPYEMNDVLLWWSGDSPLVNVRGGKNPSTQISVSENRESAMVNAVWREKMSRPMLSHFSLLDLPIETQAVYRILLTVPVGVFLLVILRNLVGIKTFGTFMPVLIALALRETQLVWGIVLFSCVVGLGLSVRFYLERLKLLLVPRLAVLLVVVIILMALISILSQKMGFYRGMSVALFPLVILTMTIERMSIVWEERGASEALQQGIGSLFVAALAYLLMQVDLLQHLVFVFPELLLILLGFLLLLGRYSGYRLLELHRFKALARVSGGV